MINENYYVDSELDNICLLIDNDEINKLLKVYGLSLLYTLPDEHRLKLEAKLGFEPATASDFYNLGVEAINEEDLKKAYKLFKNAVKVDPEHIGSYYNLGLIYEEQGDKIKAKESFKQYVTLFEEKILNNESISEQHIKDDLAFYDEAKAYLKK